ncbi:mas-related G-protein coupled receptor member X3-like [Prinia subflava]|uniref:mas-related G-protein coupled receptor member X3-like n=1 Tax=Prinia subflava TaxID=208062 RepID=UPI002FE36DDC
MEVTTVSPSPTSPTEGDNLCDIDVTNVAIHSVTLLISLCGLAGNGAVLCLLSLKDRDIGIFELAFADFLILLFTVPSTIVFLVEDMSCLPIMPLLYLSFLLQLSEVSSYWVLLQLLRANKVVVNYTALIYHILCGGNIPKRLEWLVLCTEYWAFALFTVISAVTYLCPSHQQEHCRAALISVYALFLVLFTAPLVISSITEFIRAKRGSQNQQLQRLKMVISLIAPFIFLLSLCNLLQQLGHIIVSSQVVFLLNCIHSSIKPFIYFLAGGFRRPCSLKSLRLSLQSVFGEPEESEEEEGWL